MILLSLNPAREFTWFNSGICSQTKACNKWGTFGFRKQQFSGVLSKATFLSEVNAPNNHPMLRQVGIRPPGASPIAGTHALCSTPGLCTMFSRNAATKLWDFQTILQYLLIGLIPVALTHKLLWSRILAQNYAAMVQICWVRKHVFSQNTSKFPVLLNVFAVIPQEYVKSSKKLFLGSKMSFVSFFDFCIWFSCFNKHSRTNRFMLFLTRRSGQKGIKLLLLGLGRPGKT